MLLICYVELVIQTTSSEPNGRAAVEVCNMYLRPTVQRGPKIPQAISPIAHTLTAHIDIEISN